MALVPLVKIAWANGNLDEREKQAVLAATEGFGLSKKTVNYELLENWIASSSERALRGTWRRYIEVLCGKLTEQEHISLETDLFGCARDVEEASGGQLGCWLESRRARHKFLRRLKGLFSVEC